MESKKEKLLQHELDSALGDFNDWGFDQPEFLNQCSGSESKNIVSNEPDYMNNDINSNVSTNLVNESFSKIDDINIKMKGKDLKIIKNAFITDHVKVTLEKIKPDEFKNLIKLAINNNDSSIKSTKTDNSIEKIQPTVDSLDENCDSSLEKNYNQLQSYSDHKKLISLEKENIYSKNKKIASVGQKKVKCCGHLYSLEKSYLAHLISKVDEGEHESLLLDSNMIKCQECGKWIKEAVLLPHLKKEHNIRQVCLPKPNKIKEKKQNSKPFSQPIESGSILCHMSPNKTIAVSSVSDLPFSLKPIVIIERCKVPIKKCPLKPRIVKVESLSQKDIQSKKKAVVTSIKYVKKYVPTSENKAIPNCQVCKEDGEDAPKNSPTVCDFPMQHKEIICKKPKVISIKSNTKFKKKKLIMGNGYCLQDSTDGSSSEDRGYSYEINEEKMENNPAEGVPTVDLDLFTLPSIDEDSSVFLTDPSNPNFKVLASMDAIFVGDSGQERSIMDGYVSDMNRVVYINPDHYLFPSLQDPNFDLDSLPPDVLESLSIMDPKLVMSPDKAKLLSRKLTPLKSEFMKKLVKTPKKSTPDVLESFIVKNPKLVMSPDKAMLLRRKLTPIKTELSKKLVKTPTKLKIISPLKSKINKQVPHKKMMLKKSERKVRNAKAKISYIKKTLLVPSKMKLENKLKPKPLVKKMPFTAKLENIASEKCKINIKTDESHINFDVSIIAKYDINEFDCDAIDRLSESTTSLTESEIENSLCDEGPIVIKVGNTPPAIHLAASKSSVIVHPKFNKHLKKQYPNYYIWNPKKEITSPIKSNYKFPRKLQKVKDKVLKYEKSFKCNDLPQNDPEFSLLNTIDIDPNNDVIDLPIGGTSDVVSSSPIKSGNLLGKDNFFSTPIKKSNRRRSSQNEDDYVYLDENWVLRSPSGRDIQKENLVSEDQELINLIEDYAENLNTVDSCQSPSTPKASLKSPSKGNSTPKMHLENPRNVKAVRSTLNSPRSIDTLLKNPIKMSFEPELKIPNLSQEVLLDVLKGTNAWNTQLLLTPTTKQDSTRCKEKPRNRQPRRSSIENNLLSVPFNEIPDLLSPSASNVNNKYLMSPVELSPNTVSTFLSAAKNITPKSTPKKQPKPKCLTRKHNKIIRLKADLPKKKETKVQNTCNKLRYIKQPIDPPKSKKELKKDIKENISKPLVDLFAGEDSVEFLGFPELYNSVINKICKKSKRKIEKKIKKSRLKLATQSLPLVPPTVYKKIGRSKSNKRKRDHSVDPTNANTGSDLNDLSLSLNTPNNNSIMTPWLEHNSYKKVRDLPCSNYSKGVQAGGTSEILVDQLRKSTANSADTNLPCNGELNPSKNEPYDFCGFDNGTQDSVNKLNALKPSIYWFSGFNKKPSNRKDIRSYLTSKSSVTKPYCESSSFKGFPSKKKKQKAKFRNKNKKLKINKTQDIRNYFTSTVSTSRTTDMYMEVHIPVNEIKSEYLPETKPIPVDYSSYVNSSNVSVTEHYKTALPDDCTFEGFSSTLHENDAKIRTLQTFVDVLNMQNMFNPYPLIPLDARCEWDEDTIIQQLDLF